MKPRSPPPGRRVAGPGKVATSLRTQQYCGQWWERNGSRATFTTFLFCFRINSPPALSGETRGGDKPKKLHYSPAHTHCAVFTQQKSFGGSPTFVKSVLFFAGKFFWFKGGIIPFLGEVSFCLALHYSVYFFTRWNLTPLVMRPPSSCKWRVLVDTFTTT